MANNQTKRTSAGGVHALQYPFVWCPKYRRGVLTGDGASALERLLHEKASALGVEITSLAIRPDHVHSSGHRAGDSVVMEIHLPGLNGVEATRQIRAQVPKELIHPVRQGRVRQPIGKKGLSNHRWTVGSDRQSVGSDR